ncbi:pilus (MSHA type) biogenesis protein MshL [Niveibacterium umoris]|uniref:MSHA biogenesis protein MshL n=1 Tax=Niveibacterium umoris TaxID=1193620 RepID=A0A840BG27_9RHOO|nr:pilus (MSHA type) biogenesis protein MshL [Niveibacterium umoris]MBB4012491.1 MSHA biogenesis protein MshL [Niveibacterium umoris]
MIRRYCCAALVLALLSACATRPPAYEAPRESIKAELAQAASTAPAAAASAPVEPKLMPSMRIDELPAARRQVEPQPRFDLVVNNAPAAQVLLSIVSGTPYSMILPPDFNGKITMNLRDVTVAEALAAIRQVYGYDFRVEGQRIVVQPQTLQTRVFQASHLDLQRKSVSDVRVISGSVSDGNPSNSSGNSTNSGTSTTQSSGGSSSSFVANRITSQTKSDFWNEVSTVLAMIIGEGEGRKVVVSPQTGVIVVRAMPQEIAQVETYLRAAKIALERQVILEAKIMEVQLNNQFQAGVNWAAFGHMRSDGSGRYSVGPVSPGTTLSTDSAAVANTISGIAGQTLANAATSANTLFGLVFQSNNFAAVISLLETQGKVHVLSSPRIAAMNNQAAVLKVGTDDFFVTNISSTTTTSTVSSTTPSVTLQPFFSGISLDVTPSIDENRNVTLHVHPSVSQVKEIQRQINLGTMGTLTLPLASSNVSETDSVVRGQDGQIIALGGLIREALSDDVDQVPVLGSVPLIGPLFRSTNKTVVKRELVILIRPTIVDAATSSEDVRGADGRMNRLLELDNLSFGR